MYDSVRCDVLNITYEPLQTVSVKRALRLILDGKATVTEEHPTYVVSAERSKFPVPTQIRMNYLVQSRRNLRASAQLTQQNLFARDKWSCQYCGRHKSKLTKGEMLTRDHVHPQSKGGRDIWLNVVTACNSCNNKKADYLLHEIGMKLLKQPTIPSIREVRSKAGHRKG